MQSFNSLILVGVVLLLSSTHAQSQHTLVPFPALAEFQRACTSRQHAGHFHRSGSRRYDCVLPNGDVTTLLTVATKGDPVRVIGVVYETSARLALHRSGAIDWLGVKWSAHGELVKWSRGSDGCVFSEWHESLTNTVILQCPNKTTITRMLNSPEGGRISTVHDHQN